MAKEKRGRPTEYKPEYVEQVAKLARLGAIDTQIANFFGVTETTISTWKKTYPEFLLSIKQAKLESDAMVVKSLYRRAIGFKHVETTREIPYSPEGKKENKELEITRKVTKETAPDTTACIFWLKNRIPTEWRDKQEVEHSGGINVIATKNDERL